MPLRIAIPDLISPSYFPAIAAVELGFLEREGFDATIELLFPVKKTYEELREGSVDYVGGAAHAALYAFEGWDGCRLVAALSQNMYWYLVIRAGIAARRGDLRAVKGLHIGAAPGPVDGLRRMLEVVGVDPDTDVDITPVPGTEGSGVSFGVTAAKALSDGKIDAFWANGMGAEVAIRNGTGTLLIDARRGDGPSGVQDYTFPALIASKKRIDTNADEVARVVRAIVAAQKALGRDPSSAIEVARRAGFPDRETSLIEELIERDAPFYDPSIPERKVEALNRFAYDLGILSDPDVPYDRVVGTRFRMEWAR